ncbi:hypothetical protein BDV25DRAFT_158995 [Aspergillus avenaceus]|uniref:Autophagy-related protein 29 n=1 Tax=Aspergillus avenaceus TaxID=36643 RepID=A0A5N6TP61_ASPAV|nr:hypothetical protein BDV25DRAFT_158995 [Aspergillus avenaceus]
MTSLNQSGDTNFTVFIRLPFPRGDFVDPPPAEWNASKDQALWDLLSRPSKGDDIDWKALAERFDVTLQFLLQQAAWLYDRQLSQARAHIIKIPTQSNSPSPVPGSVSGSAALPAQSKGSAVPRPPTRLPSQQKEAVPQRRKYPFRPLIQMGLTNAVPPPRRSSSATTINQATVNQLKARDHPRTEPPTDRQETQPRRPSASKRDLPYRSPTLEEEPLSSSSSESESDEDDTFSSRRGLRFHFGKMSTHRHGIRDDDEEESPAFLPLSRENSPSAPSLHDTIREDPSARRRIPEQGHIPRKSITTESSTSSTSSGAPVVLPRRGVYNLPGPLSPRRTAELAGLSPRQSNTSGRDASDGTPSMGSSYSDLEDTSVTQSALEEALMSNMQHGMASRMSLIGQSLRSRYL